MSLLFLHILLVILYVANVIIDKNKVSKFLYNRNHRNDVTKNRIYKYERRF